MNLESEQHNITLTALSYGIQPELVLAIRVAEGDPPITSEFGEFGMDRRRYPTYQLRLAGCCATLRGLLMAYLGNPFEIVPTDPNHRRLRYMQAVIIHLGRVYAPVGADNDPNDKNRNWPVNVWAEYDELTRANQVLV